MKTLDLVHFGSDSMPRLAELLHTDIELRDWVALTMDWKSFDSTVPNFVVKEVFNMFRDSIAFDQMSLDAKIMTQSK